MKSRFVPCLVMLMAGLVCSIISVEQNVGLKSFTTRLLGVLVIFYIIGSIIKVILDKAILLLSDKEELVEESIDENESSVEEKIDNNSEIEEPVD